MTIFEDTFGELSELIEKEKKFRRKITDKIESYKIGKFLFKSLKYQGVSLDDVFTDAHNFAVTEFYQVPADILSGHPKKAWQHMKTEFEHTGRDFKQIAASNAGPSLGGRRFSPADIQNIYGYIQQHQSSGMDELRRHYYVPQMYIPATPIAGKNVLEQ